MKILDTNMILRFLLNDNQDMAKQVEELIDNNFVMVTSEVIAEVIYVMKSVYKIAKSDITQTLLEFVSLPTVTAEHLDVIEKGITLYAENNLDFVDCLLCAYNLQCGYEICTFDKKLNKLIENKSKS